jgi:hypothetical protein
MRKLIDEALIQSELLLYRSVEFVPREILSILSDGLLDDASDLLLHGASLDNITYPNLVTNMLDAVVFVDDFLAYGKAHKLIAADTVIQDPKVNGELVLCRLKKVIMCNWKKSIVKVLESKPLRSKSPSSFVAKDIEALIRSTDIKYDQHQHVFAEYLESGASFLTILNMNRGEASSLPLISLLRQQFEIASSLMILRFLLLVKSLELCEDWYQRGFGSMHSPYVRHEKSWGMIDTQSTRGDDEDEPGQDLEIACFPKLLSEINDMNNRFGLSMNSNYTTSFCACLANMRCCSFPVKGNPDDVLRTHTSSNGQQGGETLPQTSIWVTIMHHDLPKEAIHALKRLVSIVHQNGGVDEEQGGVSQEDVNRSDGIGCIESFPILDVDEKKKVFRACLPIVSVRVWKDVEIDSLMATAANVHMGQIVRIDDYESLLVAHKRFDWWEYAEEDELKVMSSKKAEVISIVEAFTRHRIGVKFEFNGRVVMDAIPIECLIHYLFDPDFFSSSSSSNDSKAKKKSGRMLTSIAVDVHNQKDDKSMGENTRKYLSSISEFIKVEKKVQKLRDFDKNRGKKKRISMRDRSIDSIDWSTIGSDATMNLSAHLDEGGEDYQGDERGVAFNTKKKLKRKTPLSKPLGIPVPIPPRKSKVNGNRQSSATDQRDTDRSEPVSTRDALKEMQPHSTMLKENVALHEIHSGFDWIQPPPVVEEDEESQPESSPVAKVKDNKDDESGALAVVVTKVPIRGYHSSYNESVEEGEDQWKPTFGDILAMTANSVTNRVVSDVVDIFEPEQHIESKLVRRSKQLLTEYRVDSQTRHKDHLHIAPLRLIAVPRESRRTFTTNPTSEALIRQVLQEASESDAHALETSRSPLPQVNIHHCDASGFLLLCTAAGTAHRSTAKCVKWFETQGRFSRFAPDSVAEA